MTIENFEYDLLNESKFGRDETYTALLNEGFFVMSHNHIQYAGNFDYWKIHISIDDEGAEGRVNLTNAWRIVAETLMDNNVYSFKIIAARYLPMVNKTLKENGKIVSQGGKQITIYSGIPIEQDKDWPRIMQDITDRFIENNIRPSYLPKGDRSIQGSPYFSYRHELGSRLGFSVPANQEDLYADIILTLPREANIVRKQWPEVELDIEQGIQVAVAQPEPVNEEEYIEERASCCRCPCTII